MKETGKEHLGEIEWEPDEAVRSVREEAAKKEGVVATRASRACIRKPW